MGKTVLGFLPWIVYSALAGGGENGILKGAIMALFVALICGRKNLRKGFILDWCTVFFFVFVLVVGVYLRHPVVTQHPELFSNTVLAIIAIGSLLAGVPFTAQYAREQTPREHWNSPIFKRINQVLTLTWGMTFALSAWLSWLLPDSTYTVVNIILLAIAIGTTVKFPDWYRGRATRH
jgi:hypothetical protein